MNNKFYEEAIALRQQIQEDRYLTHFRLSVLAQIVGAVFANGDKIPHEIQIQYPYNALPHNHLPLMDEIVKKLSISYVDKGDRFLWTSRVNSDIRTSARTGFYCITYFDTK